MFSRIKDFFFKKTTTPFYLSLCCIVKDETEYIEEWVRYHLLIGVDHFYIYDNDSKIPVLQTVKDSNLLQYVTVIKFPGRRKQLKAYEHCLKSFKNSSRWIGFIDLDEFIVPKSTKGDLPAYLKNFETYGGLGINWQMFGSSGYKKRTGRSQMESFVLKSDENFTPNQHIKSIVQPKRVKSKAWNAHSFDYRKPYFCVNEKFEWIPYPITKANVSDIQINHYYCRSLEEYEDKMKRGYADQTRPRTIDGFFSHDKDCNILKDTAILEIVDYRSKSAIKDQVSSENGFLLSNPKV